MHRRLFWLYILLGAGLWGWENVPFRPSHAAISPAAIFDGEAAETTLALGAKLAYFTSDLYALELIKGVSDTLGSAALSAKPKVFHLAHSLSCESQPQALLAIRGVGEKKAFALAEYLSFEPLRCLSKSAPSKKGPLKSVN